MQQEEMSKAFGIFFDMKMKHFSERESSILIDPLALCSLLQNELSEMRSLRWHQVIRHDIKHKRVSMLKSHSLCVSWELYSIYSSSQNVVVEACSATLFTDKDERSSKIFFHLGAKKVYLQGPTVDGVSSCNCLPHVADVRMGDFSFFCLCVFSGLHHGYCS